MAMTIVERFEREREKVVSQCTKCGICISKCQILKYTDLNGMSSVDIQGKVIDFLKNGKSDAIVYTKAFACMECYECAHGRCLRI